MSQFMRFFSGKCQYFGNRAGVKHLTNIMSVVMMIRRMRMTTWPHFPLIPFVRHFFSEGSLAPKASFHKKTSSSLSSDKGAMYNV